MQQTRRIDGTYEGGFFLTESQLKAEMAKCEFCQEKPCKEACPCDCSPADFIKAAQLGTTVDIQRAAALIMSKNPLGGVCGLVCPDKHCMAACVHRRLDGSVNIPAVQAAIIQRAKDLGVMPSLERAAESGKRVAVMGGGPAGLAAAAQLSLSGHQVVVLEAGPAAGGMCRAIPPMRMPHEALASDVEWLGQQGGIELKVGTPVREPAKLLGEGYDAVVVAIGLWEPIHLGIPGEDLALAGTSYLENASAHDLRGRNVAVIGGGATAFDCAMTAREQGAARVEMLALETVGEMPLSQSELADLLQSDVDVSGRTRVDKLHVKEGSICGISTVKVRLREGSHSFSLAAIEPIRGTEARRDDLDTVVVAIGNRPAARPPEGADEVGSKVFWAGDVVEGPTTVVEAAAAGKEAALRVNAALSSEPQPDREPRVGGHVKSRIQLPGYNFKPVPLEIDFFGRTIRSPFLLSAAPPTDGLEQMSRAYETGWAGAVMKTAFDGIPIHIPAEYMFAFGRGTYANCDNVSGHPLERVCREVEQLVTRFPDRLTIASTGGPVTGDDEADARQWQSNTRKLEDAGAMGIEYSLSCPQGGDGTEGDIVSQNAALTVKIIDWILGSGRGDVPKLFKLTGAVTSIASIVGPIREVLARHPDKPAGITLANTFPTLAFRTPQAHKAERKWDEGVIVGMSGQGVLPISYLTLAKAAPIGVTISGNGGPMDYRAAANFLALGARTVQFCTIVTRDGYGIIDHLESGLSHLLARRGIASVEELCGIALPEPVTDFMDLTPVKRVSAPDRELCLRCGNCSRCPYLAISHDSEGYPVTDPSRCIGCSICALKCFAGAISMRERTSDELAALKED